MPAGLSIPLDELPRRVFLQWGTAGMSSLKPERFRR